GDDIRHAGLRVHAVEYPGGMVRAERLVAVLEDQAKQRLLVAVVIVERVIVDAGGPGNAVDARPGDAVPSELAQRRAQDRRLGARRLVVFALALLTVAVVMDSLGHAQAVPR